ncbi:MAG: nucleotidyltransferase family protein [Verrucomicrobiota bacterium]
MLFDETSQKLREALHELAPGCEFWVCGSLFRRGTFNPASAVDLAWTALPGDLTEFRLTAELAERLGRLVDLVELNRSRLRTKTLREGEGWIA